MMSTEQQATTPRFWRDPALPFVETREALDGRLLCYAKHSHECFSIGTITRGRSTYLNEKAREQVAAMHRARHDAVNERARRIIGRLCGSYCLRKFSR